MVQIESLQQALKDKNDEIAMIKDVNTNMVHATESRELFVGDKTSDDKLVPLFETLMGQIAVWSHCFTDLQGVGTERVPDFEKVLPCAKNPQHFLQELKQVRRFVRGYVGLAISEQIFRTLPTAACPQSRGLDAWTDSSLAQSALTIEDSLFSSGNDPSPLYGIRMAR